MPEHDWWVERIAVIDGVVLKLAANGTVYWASRWERVDELGLRRTHHGPATYGHVSYHHDAPPTLLVHQPTTQWRM
jgi:hypothetical protein